METDDETLLLKLQEVGSGPGGATVGNLHPGELLLLAKFFSADLRSIFERVKVQLAVLDSPAGSDSISILTSPKVAEAFFRRVEKLVAGEVASSDVFINFNLWALDCVRVRDFLPPAVYGARCDRDFDSDE
jgi:hypothetical protein